MSQSDPHIDLSAIEFPSDQVSIKHLRKLFPKELNSWPSEFADFDEIELPAMLDMERRLASRIYNTVLGKKSAKPLGGWDQDRTDLAALYVRYALADGPHHAEQLIRTFEQAVAATAKKSASSPPSP